MHCTARRAGVAKSWLESTATDTCEGSAATLRKAAIMSIQTTTLPKPTTRPSSVAAACGALFLCAGTLAAQSAPSTHGSIAPLAQLDNAVESLVGRVSPSIVQVLVTALGPVAAPGRALMVEREQVIGSGVVVDSGGLILTNAHVVSGAERVKVALAPAAGGSVFDARVIGLDKETDLAVLKVETTGLRPLRFGDSDRLHEGQLAFTFGSPAGLANSVTMGVVSSVAREIDPDHPIVYIQTDAPINPGNSGGALVDTEGELVGINTFILSQSGGSEGLGFAVPSNIAEFVYRQLQAHGHVHRGAIGMTGQEVNPVLAKGLGLGRDWGILVEDVVPGGPAATAGLAVGDVVVGLNDQPVGSLAAFVTDVTMRNVGRAVRLTVLRGPERLAIQVPVVEQRDSLDRLVGWLDPEKNAIRRIGILGVAIDSTTAPLLPGLRIPTGVLVVARAVDAGGVETGLLPGDVIHAVNRTPVGSVADLRGRLRALKSGDAVVLGIERQGALMFLPFEFD